jgi:hypothetical protein
MARVSGAWIVECLVGTKKVFGPQRVTFHEMSEGAMKRCLQMLAARYAELTGREILQSHQRGAKDGLFPVHLDVAAERYHLLCVCGDATAIARREAWKMPRINKLEKADVG